jgi:hypothetical protein
LLLDRERPGVQQRLLHRGAVEIAGLEPEEEIGGKGDDGCDRTKELQSFGSQQIMKRRDRRQRHHRVERRQQPAHPTLVESRKRKRAVLDFRLDDTGDQVAGDHEKDIDADKTAVNGRRLEMERDHRQHGDGPEPVDVFTIGACHNGRAASGRRPVTPANTRVAVIPPVRPS